MVKLRLKTAVKAGLISATLLAGMPLPSVAGPFEEALAVTQITKGVSQDGVSRDVAQKRLEAHAEQGNVAAQYNMGVLHSAGLAERPNKSEAVKWYRQAADSGDVWAMFNLAIMYSSGEGVPADHGEATTWLRKAAEAGDSLARYELAVGYANGRGVPRDEAEAVRWLKLAADGRPFLCEPIPDVAPGSIATYQADPNNSIYQNALGWHYATGRYVQQDDAEAVRLFREAARDKAKPVPKRCNLAYMLAAGRGTEKDEAEAFRLFKLALSPVDSGARLNLALMHALGRGTPQDDAEAAKWLRMAATDAPIARMHIWALVDSGFDQSNVMTVGRGLRRNLDEAVKGYRKAASDGNPEAQCSIARMHLNGVGLTEDLAEARRWASAAANHGHAGCQSLLGSLYEQGKGVPPNYSQAISWYRKAAEQGDIDAQVALADFYKSGRGVKKDFFEAYKWLSIAVSRMDRFEVMKKSMGLSRSARADYERIYLETQLTPQQVERAQRVAQEWKPRSQGKSIAIPEIREASEVVAGKPVATVTKTLPKPQGGPPTVALKPIPATEAQSVEVRGKVTAKGKITGLQVDETEVPVGPDGTFSVRRGIPLGESVIKVVATDEWGRTSESTIKVNRTVASTETDYPPVRSNLIHGKARPNAVALIIGVERYKSVPQADFAENDAKAFYDFAVNSLGIPASRVKLLTGPDAQKVDVDAAILTWLKPLVVSGKTDVFVYFSGHGLASDDGKDLFLLPQDGNRALLDRSAIRRSELIDMVASGGVRSATFFIDACYSGGTRGTEALVAAARPILLAAKEQPVPSNVTILTAAANDQLSSALGQAKHGLFSYFLMRGLSGEAAGGDRTITAGELASYLTNRVPPEAAKLGRVQTPQVIGDAGRVITTW